MNMDYEVIYKKYDKGGFPIERYEISDKSILSTINEIDQNSDIILKNRMSNLDRLKFNNIKPINREIDKDDIHGNFAIMLSDYRTDKKIDYNRGPYFYQDVGRYDSDGWSGYIDPIYPPNYYNITKTLFGFIINVEFIYLMIIANYKEVDGTPLIDSVEINKNIFDGIEDMIAFIINDKYDFKRLCFFNLDQKNIYSSIVQMAGYRI